MKANNAAVETTPLNTLLSERKAGERTEAELIRRAQQGSHEAFSGLMDLYRERMMRLALYMIGNSEDAYDLCQEIFVKVYRALGTFDSKRPFSPWIYRVAHNVITDFMRAKKAKPALLESVTEQPFEERRDDNGVDPQQMILSQETRRQVHAAIQSLPDNYRSVVVFRFIDDLSYAEIAEALDLTEANVMMRMSRARRMLRDKLEYLQI
ncbi:MAG: sigma-70 family RNA polymerase sigma factor [Armatimonadetes bacterium]|nr:sigma-70 family RNA polymerase sigma factor [Armatimonadota bacterium]